MSKSGKSMITELEEVEKDKGKEKVIIGSKF